MFPSIGLSQTPSNCALVIEVGAFLVAMAGSRGRWFSPQLKTASKIISKMSRVIPQNDLGKTI